MKRLLFIFMTLLAADAYCREISFEELRTLAASGKSLTVEESLELSGVVISIPKHENLADGVQVNFRSNSSTQNNRTAYMQSPDGKYGVKLVFQHFDPEGAKATRYSRLKLSMKGCTVRHGLKGDISIEDIPNGAVQEVTAGQASDLPVKAKTVRELTADDLHTWVTLKDCEFVFKDGAYTNILESYARPNPDNSQYKPNSYMDTWQTLLCDSNASPFYMVINSRTTWRRNGKGVPQGKGDISGILVVSDNPRYGKTDLWQIRPLEQEDIAFEWKGESSFKTLAEWNWNDNASTFATNEGHVERFRHEKMIPDVGKGELSLDFVSSTYRGPDVNNPMLEPSKEETKGSKGLVRKGAMEIRAIVSNWWNWSEDCGNAVVLKFSTKDITAEKLFLAFSFSSGKNSTKTSRYNPAFWGVEVSTDNVAFARMDIPEITLRSLPWWEKTVDGVHYKTSCEAGLGMTEHLVELPASLIGQETVYVRICPVKKNLTTLAMENSTNAALRPNLTHWSSVSFGAITIRYR